MHTTIRHMQPNNYPRNVKLCCIFSVVPGKGPTPLETPDCMRLYLLSINCDTLDMGWNNGLVNKQSKQNKSNQMKI